MSKEIKILGLSSGDIIIAETEVTGDTIMVSNPMVMTQVAERKIELANWMPFLDSENIEIHKNFAAIKGNPTETFLKEYQRYLSEKNKELLLPADKKLIVQ